MTRAKKLFSREEIREIYSIIYENMEPDDRFPKEVITDRYNGNEEEYLKAMIRWLDIPIKGHYRLTH